MRRASRFLVQLSGLAFALLPLNAVLAQEPQVPTTQADVAQARTAQGPQARANVQIEVVSLSGPSTSLRTQYAQMIRQSGKVLIFGTDTGGLPLERFVLYAPLNRLWVLDATGEVTHHAFIEVKQDPVDHLVLHWTHWLDGNISDIIPAAAQMPVFTVEAETPHPLAAAYDALLIKPLARAFDPLPTAAYFSAGGHIFDAAGVQIAEWDSYGAEIAMRGVPAVEGAADTRAGSKPESTTAPLWQWFSVADLAAALTPKQGEN